MHGDLQHMRDMLQASSSLRGAPAPQRGGFSDKRSLSPKRGKPQTRSMSPPAPADCSPGAGGALPLHSSFMPHASAVSSAVPTMLSQLMACDTISMPEEEFTSPARPGGAQLQLAFQLPPPTPEPLSGPRCAPRDAEGYRVLGSTPHDPVPTPEVLALSLAPNKGSLPRAADVRSVSPQRPAPPQQRQLSEEEINDHIEGVLSGAISPGSPVVGGGAAGRGGSHSPAAAGPTAVQRLAPSLEPMDHPGCASFWVRSGTNAKTLSRKTQVSFYGRRLGDVVAYSTRDVVMQIGCKVETVDVGCTDMTHRGAAALGDGLSLLTASTVTMVKLNGNPLVGDSGVEALLAKLQPSVRILEVGDCGLTPSGAAAIAKNLARLPLLRELYIFCNPELGDAGAAHLARAVSNGHAFDVLDMQGCNISGKARDWLRAAGIRAIF